MPGKWRYGMKIICVCGTGQGSSLILRMSIDEILKSKGIKADVDNTDPSCAGGERCDFIVASREIAGSISNPRARTIVVTSYFNKAVLEREIAEIINAASGGMKV